MPLDGIHALGAADAARTLRRRGQRVAGGSRKPPQLEHGSRLTGRNQARVTANMAATAGWPSKRSRTHRTRQNIIGCTAEQSAAWSKTTSPVRRRRKANAKPLSGNPLRTMMPASRLTRRQTAREQDRPPSAIDVARNWDCRLRHAFRLVPAVHADQRQRHPRRRSRQGAIAALSATPAPQQDQRRTTVQEDMEHDGGDSRLVSHARLAERDLRCRASTPVCHGDAAAHRSTAPASQRHQLEQLLVPPRRTLSRDDAKSKIVKATQPSTAPRTRTSGTAAGSASTAAAPAAGTAASSIPRRSCAASACGPSYRWRPSTCPWRALER